MKRDLTLIVDLLTALENATEANEHINVIDILNVPSLQNKDDNIVLAHIILCDDAGFVERRSIGGVVTVRLRWAGYKALERTRESLAWAHLDM